MTYIESIVKEAFENDRVIVEGFGDYVKDKWERAKAELPGIGRKFANSITSTSIDNIVQVAPKQIKSAFAALGLASPTSLIPVAVVGAGGIAQLAALYYGYKVYKSKDDVYSIFEQRENTVQVLINITKQRDKNMVLLMDPELPDNVQRTITREVDKQTREMVNTANSMLQKLEKSFYQGEIDFKQYKQLRVILKQAAAGKLTYVGSR